MNGASTQVAYSQAWNTIYQIEGCFSGMLIIWGVVLRDNKLHAYISKRSRKSIDSLHWVAYPETHSWNAKNWARTLSQVSRHRIWLRLCILPPAITFLFSIFISATPIEDRVTATLGLLSAVFIFLGAVLFVVIMDDFYYRRNPAKEICVRALYMCEEYARASHLPGPTFDDLRVLLAQATMLHRSVERFGRRPTHDPQILRHIGGVLEKIRAMQRQTVLKFGESELYVAAAVRASLTLSCTTEWSLLDEADYSPPPQARLRRTLLVATWIFVAVSIGAIIYSYVKGDKSFPTLIGPTFAAALGLLGIKQQS